MFTVLAENAVDVQNNVAMTAKKRVSFFMICYGVLMLNSIYLVKLQFYE
jgi:hypothetical protein